MDNMSEYSTEESDIREYLIFTVSAIDFGIDISLVQEIIQMQPIFQIPNAYASCKGIINMRGTIVPVIDMSTKLGYEPGEYSEKTCIIVIEVEAEQIGMIVDKVNDVMRIAPGDLSGAPSVGSTAENAGLISEIATVGGTITQILDVYTVFEIDR